MMIDTSLAEMTVCGIALISVGAPPLYAWLDRWMDRTRSVKVDVTKAGLQGNADENKKTE